MPIKKLGLIQFIALCPPGVGDSTHTLFAYECKPVPYKLDGVTTVDQVVCVATAVKLLSG